MLPQDYLLILFAFIIVGFLVVDLGYFNRRPHRISGNTAFLQTLFWIGLALSYSSLIFIFMGKELGVQFLSAYVTEEMLSIDNLFVILLIFNFFNLDEKYHHRVLFWGIMGAVVFRAIFILLGAYIVSQFHWILYIFGAVLLYTGFNLFFEKKEKHVNYQDSKIIKLAKKFLPFTTAEHHGKFFVRENGKLHATMLFMIILLVESTDIIFAIDSIPAAFSITQNPFILFTANIFAVMGLRALFFLIEHVVHRFHHLQKGLSFILIFVGAKMLASFFHFHLSSMTSFFTIMGILGASLLASVLFPKKI